MAKCAGPSWCAANCRALLKDRAQLSSIMHLCGLLITAGGSAIALAHCAAEGDVAKAGDVLVVSAVAMMRGLLRGCVGGAKYGLETSVRSPTSSRKLVPPATEAGVGTSAKGGLEWPEVWWGTEPGDAGEETPTTDATGVTPAARRRRFNSSSLRSVL